MVSDFYLVESAGIENLLKLRRSQVSACGRFQRYPDLFRDDSWKAILKKYRCPVGLSGKSWSGSVFECKDETCTRYLSFIHLLIFL